MVGVDVPNESGGLDPARTGCGVVDIPSRRSGFVVGFMVSAYGMQTSRTESAVGLCGGVSL
jgi:hypothetical protein